VWGDYCALKTILLGMWRVAAGSLAGISAASEMYTSPAEPLPFVARL
jgi:hypothetical protein